MWSGISGLQDKGGLCWVELGARGFCKGQDIDTVTVIVLVSPIGTKNIHPPLLAFAVSISLHDLQLSASQKVQFWQLTP